MSEETINKCLFGKARLNIAKLMTKNSLHVFIAVSMMCSVCSALVSICKFTVADFVSSLLKEMIDFADKNGDGEVSKKEFLKMMKYD